MKPFHHHWPVRTRREFFTRAGSGLAGLALSSMLAESAPAPKRDPLEPRPAHHQPTAKSVIFLFMEGGPSHIDLFDPKPKLNELHGQPMPASFGKVITAMGTANNSLMGSPRTWQQHGQSGLWVSDWYPRIATHADRLAVIRSCWADGLNHVGSVCQMNTGDILAGRPSLGAWATYGLGAGNRNLPTFVVMVDQGLPLGGAKTWSSGFLPAVYQGTLFRQGDAPILHLLPPEGVTKEEQRAKIDLLNELNRLHAASRQDDGEFDARIRSYELAYQMQATGPEVVELDKEPEAVKELYGMNAPETASFGRNCLLARRLVERGVRFVELYCGSGSAWDAHANIEANHGRWCRVSDQPIAALLTDLERRGLLDQTLVVWGGEFGRTPFNEKGNGRDHNPWGFTMWMAGGGVRGGQAIGTTDEIGLRAVDRPYHVHDIHASILHALGLDHLRVTYQHNGRAERPTMTGGTLIQGLFA
ncbi:MAG TPA: DUF1501 domain-containing protein [Solibacterales bacterium]|nr:DUF1501 domain-containing protein [Bryobacterales bacterium]